MNKIYLVLLTLIFSLNINAQENLLQEANEVYKIGKYSEAVEAYENIVNSNLEAPELYFNLGNAYYRTGNIPAAILNYERASLLDPSDSDIKYNLEMSKKMIKDKIEGIPHFFINRWITKLIMTQSSDAWAWFSIITFILVLIALLMFLFTSSVSIKKFTFFISVLLLTVSVLAMSFSFSQKKRLERREYAIIFAPSVTIKGSPDKSGTELFLLHEGTKVKILETLGEWANIQLSDGNEGWILLENIERI